MQVVERVSLHNRRPCVALRSSSGAVPGAAGERGGIITSRDGGAHLQRTLAALKPQGRRFQTAYPSAERPMAFDGLKARADAKDSPQEALASPDEQALAGLTGIPLFPAAEVGAGSRPRCNTRERRSPSRRSRAASR